MTDLSVSSANRSTECHSALSGVISRYRFLPLEKSFELSCTSAAQSRCLATVYLSFHGGRDPFV